MTALITSNANGIRLISGKLIKLKHFEHTYSHSVLHNPIVCSERYKNNYIHLDVRFVIENYLKLFLVLF